MSSKQAVPKSPVTLKRVLPRLLLQLFDWGQTGSEGKQRLLTFYRLADRIADRLKGLFVLFAGNLVKPFSDLLQQTNVSKTGGPCLQHPFLPLNIKHTNIMAFWLWGKVGQFGGKGYHTLNGHVIRMWDMFDYGYRFLFLPSAHLKLVLGPSIWISWYSFVR